MSNMYVLHHEDDVVKREGKTIAVYICSGCGEPQFWRYEDQRDFGEPTLLIGHVVCETCQEESYLRYDEPSEDVYLSSEDYLDSEEEDILDEDSYFDSLPDPTRTRA